MKNFLRFLNLFMLMMLSGCMNLAFTSAQLVYDHNNIQKKLTDNYITLKAYRSIYTDTDVFKNSDISIATLNQVVLLVGQTPSEQLKLNATHIIEQVPHVKRVYNFLEVGPAIPAAIAMSDTWISTKIKANLITAEDIDPSQITVVTSNGIVYLMGIVTKDQAEIAVDIARETDGVQCVVRIFSYIKICKTPE